MAEVPLFPQGIIGLLRWSERPGSLPEVLHLIGGIFEARARSKLFVTTTLAGLLSIHFVIVGSFMLVIGLILPMIQLVSQLSG